MPRPLKSEKKERVLGERAVELISSSWVFIWNHHCCLPVPPEGQAEEPLRVLDFKSVYDDVFKVYSRWNSILYDTNISTISVT